MFLLDTNVVSELRKKAAGRADQYVVAWADDQRPINLFISAMTVFELEVGIQRAERADPPTGQVLRSWLRDDVLRTFSGRIRPADVRVMSGAAKLQVPDPMSIGDSLIAATAIDAGFTLVTRNVSDFKIERLPILNPWEPHS